LQSKTPQISKKDIEPELLPEAPIPQHIAIIMDGNGRWAKSKGKPRAFGHREGVRSVREIVSICGEIGIKYLTIYTFSTENWNRPQDEVSLLMKLLVTSLRDEIKNLIQNNVRILTIGETSKLPTEAQRELLAAMDKTKNNTGLTLNVALSYSGRWDILQAAKRIASEYKHGKIALSDVDDALFSSHMSTAMIPDPDLLIRTSGEFRLSNFLLWNLAYTEIYITPCYWPDFRREELMKAIRDFQMRERRFGLVSEQLKKKSAKRPSHNQGAPHA
jgi:undecaprenyl diphosphate synthase